MSDENKTAEAVPTSDEWVTVEEAVVLLDRDPSNVYGLVKSGVLTGREAGRRLVSRESIAAYQAGVEARRVAVEGKATRGEAATFLGLSVEQLRKLGRRSVLPYTKIGNERYFAWDDLREYKAAAEARAEPVEKKRRALAEWRADPDKPAVPDKTAPVPPAAAEDSLALDAVCNVLKMDRRVVERELRAWGVPRKGTGGRVFLSFPRAVVLSLLMKLEDLPREEALALMDRRIQDRRERERGKWVGKERTRRTDPDRTQAPHGSSPMVFVGTVNKRLEGVCESLNLDPATWDKLLKAVLPEVYADPPAPTARTDALPGTAEKLQCFEARADSGKTLFCAADARWEDDDRAEKFDALDGGNFSHGEVRHYRVVRRPPGTTAGLPWKPEHHLNRQPERMGNPHRFHVHDEGKPADLRAESPACISDLLHA